jgi:hypothetical protein
VDRRDLASETQPEDGELAFLIDFDPDSESHIGIVEIESIHAFTVGNRRSKAVFWTPLMIELVTLRNDEDHEHLTPGLRRKLTRSFTVANRERSPCVEFLYLHGTELSWNWGKSGMTNAALLGPDARSYFRTFF